jgi:SAM-dependent methyltransferase
LFLKASWAKGLPPGQSFDACCPSPLLVKYISEGRIPEGRALVPGCGRGYDVTVLASHTRIAFGWDISSTAITAAQKRLEELAPSECSCKEHAIFQQQSFFDFFPADNDEKFDFVYDYTFLCALNPSIRHDWAKKMAELIKEGGELLALIFPINSERINIQSPPFPVTLELLKELLEPVGFECLELSMLPKELCHKGRDGSADDATITSSGEKLIAASGVGRWKRL